MSQVVRRQLLARIRAEARVHSVVALLGPRQAGKSTLARQFLAKTRGDALYFDLEDPGDLSRLDSPMLALAGHRGWVVLDEIQRRPDLFPVLRVLADRERSTKFLVLGSASRDLLQQSSESLAGRMGTVEVMPFSHAEVPDLDRLWLRGGYPRSYLPRTIADSVTWRRAYLATHLERDLPTLGIDVPVPLMRRFWLMLTHYHGQTFNASEIARSLQISDKTARRYLDVLTSTFMVRQLQPWFENIGKRQVKAPKVYLRDTGLLHALLDISSPATLMAHPRLGASWEGFALEQVIRKLGVTGDECFFWGIHGEVELDLLVTVDGSRVGYEMKYTDRPAVTASMRRSVDLLGLRHLTIVVPGAAKPYRLHESITVTTLSAL